MPALIAFQCTLIVSNFQIDVILLNGHAETHTYCSLGKQARPRSAPAQVFPSPVANTTTSVSCFCEPCWVCPSARCLGRTQDGAEQRGHSWISPQLSSGCQGGASPLFIPVLPQESCGLPRVRESIILLNFKGCV